MKKIGDLGVILDVPSAHRFDATHWQLAILGVDEKGCPREAVWLSLHPGLAKLQARKGKKMCGRWEASTTPMQFSEKLYCFEGAIFEWRKWQNNRKHLFSTGHLHYFVVSYFDQKTEQQDIIKHNQ